jgi:hypothetical protein
MNRETATIPRLVCKENFKIPQENIKIFKFDINSILLSNQLMPELFLIKPYD